MKYTLVNRVLFAQKRRRSKQSTQNHKTALCKPKKIHEDNCTVIERVRDLYCTTQSYAHSKGKRRICTKLGQITRGSGKKNKCGCRIKKISLQLSTKNVFLLFPYFYLYICIGRYSLWVGFENQLQLCHCTDVGRVIEFRSPTSALSVCLKFDAIWSMRLGFVGEVRSLLTPRYICPPLLECSIPFLPFLSPIYIRILIHFWPKFHYSIYFGITYILVAIKLVLFYF